MSDAVEQIKAKLDIVDFLRPYVNMVPAGRNFKSNCPFHKEKSPSFMINPDRQRWHCFGCGLDGDVVAFLMKYENIDFIEALKILGEKTGVDIGRVGTADQKQFNVLYDINKAAKDFFKKQLVTEAGKPAIEYLKKRGMKGETAKEFEVGFIPDGGDMLTRYLTGAGYKVQDVERAGLAFKTDRGTFIDRFRNRIMFPLYNHFGKVIGFTGRIMPGAANADRVGKYVNSPETPIFNKSKTLYGFDKSKNAVREANKAVLVEGQMDFIMAWQDGIKNLVATSGTALTIEHLKALRRVADKLVLSFDQDEAGKIATERAIDLAGAADFSASVIRVPADLEVKDPADIALAKPGMLKDLIESAQPAMEFYFDRYRIQSHEGEWKKNARVVLSKIKFLSSPMERDYWLKEASRRSGTDEAVLIEEMEALKVTAPQAKEEPEAPVVSEAAPVPLNRKEVISQRIASLVVSYKSFYPVIEPHINNLPEHYRIILKSTAEGTHTTLSGASSALLDLISMRAGLEANADEGKAREELGKLFLELRREILKEDRQRVSLAIQNAERENQDTTPLFAEKQRIATELNQLDVRGVKVL